MNLGVQLGSSSCCRCNYTPKCRATPSAHPAASLVPGRDRFLLSPSCQNLKVHAGARGAFQPIREESLKGNSPLGICMAQLVLVGRIAFGH